VRWGLLTIVIVAELVFITWAMMLPLPNANNAIGAPAESEPMRRGWLLLKAFPEVIPGTTFEESFLGTAAREFSHVGNLPQRVPVVLAAGLIMLAAMGLGELLLAGLRLNARLALWERLALDYGLGAAVLGVITLLFGRAGLLSPWVVRAALLGVVAISAFVVWRRGSARSLRDPAQTPDALPESRNHENSWSPWWLLGGALVAPFVAAMLLGSMLPTIDFDVLEYHIQGPKEYFQTGRISFLAHNVYTSMPFGIEMLHLLGMHLMGDWWWGALVGQLLVALFGLAAAVLVAGTAWRVGSARAAWFAFVIYLTTPWIYRLGVIAYVEGPLCYYHAALVWGFVRLAREPGLPARAVWSIMGLLAGGAMGCKYPGLISAVIPFGLVAVWESWRRGSVVVVLAYLVGWAVVMGPWLGKNVVDTGDPVYPLGYRVFGGRYWDDEMAVKWEATHGRRTVELPALWESIVDVAARSDWQSPLYGALAPLAFLRFGSRRAASWLWVYAVYLFATWWLLTHRVDRFWLPILPTLAVLAGLGADWVRSWAWSLFLAFVFAAVLVANFADISTVLTGLNEWTGDLVAMRKAIPRALNKPLARLDAELPQGARTLLVGQAAVFHLNHPVVYNTVFNRETIELLAAGKSSPEFARALKDAGLTHIYVDWKEIERHRKPGGYGFTDFVTRERFATWVKDGVLGPPALFGDQQELYEVR
jgi:4-amino-4-deoxy-L-arabinose transferase-like glycosyltransferase